MALGDDEGMDHAADRHGQKRRLEQGTVGADAIDHHFAGIADDADIPQTPVAVAHRMGRKG